MELSGLEQEILRLLADCRGEGNALRRRNLAEILVHLGGERRIRAAIKHLLFEHGIPIASSSAGYFMPATVDEVQRTCDYYHSYAMACLTAESRLRKMGLADLVGQIRMDLVSRKDAKGAKEGE